MKIPETGRICGNVLKAIDEFSSKYELPSGIWKKREKNGNPHEMLCPCGICTGFGSGKYSEQKQSSKVVEAYRKYEYPGIHRSLLWSLKAVIFYLNKTNNSLGYSLKYIESGYRCHERNKQKGRNSTNHMGKALDLHFNKNEKRASSVKEMEDIRLNIFNKYLGAKWDWKNKNVFNLESTSIGATSWVHYDVREFDLVYLKDEYFIKNQLGLNGKSIVYLAEELGFSNTCNCLGTTNIQKEEEKVKDDRVDPKTLKTSQKGKEFIKDWEDFHSKPYDDSEGYATIGYGYLIAYKSYTKVTQTDIAKTEITWKEFTEGITKERALQLFEKKVIKYEKAIQRDIKVNLYQYEFDALVSLVFNTGENFLNTGGVKKGETKIKKNINAKKYSEGADEFGDVTNSGTRGLIKRRKAEINMFKNNIYDSTH